MLRLGGAPDQRFPPEQFTGVGTGGPGDDRHADLAGPDAGLERVGEVTADLDLQPRALGGEMLSERSA